MSALAFAVACAVLGVCAWLLPALAAELLAPTVEEQRQADEARRSAELTRRLAETRAEIIEARRQGRRAE